MRTILNRRPLYFAYDCSIHGKVDHEIVFKSYSAYEHTCSCKVTCLQCYEDAKYGDGTYPYVELHFDTHEWMRVVDELDGEVISDN
jgi:hypothetical protein